MATWMLNKGYSPEWLLKATTALRAHFPKAPMAPVPFDFMVVERSGPVCWFFGTVLRQQAVTLNRRVYVTLRAFGESDVDKFLLLSHEAYHVAQQRSWGRNLPAFVAWGCAYLALHAWSCLRVWVGEHRAWTPRDHSWERPAYEYEDEVWSLIHPGERDEVGP